MIRSLLFLFIITFLAPPAVAQCPNVLRGLVEDDHGEVLVGATIWIEQLKSGVVSDITGKFEIDQLCPGTYHVEIRFLGYEDQHLTIRIPTVQRLVIKMKSSVRVLHDIVIEGDHSLSHGLTQSLGVLNEEELASMKGKSLGEMLQKLPGVSSLMTGPSIYKPVIHGLHSQRILILNNGIRQEGQQWGIEHAPEIDTYIATELEVVKGSEVVRYGSDAIGGVVLVNPLPLHYTSGLGGEIHTGISSNNRMGVVSAMLEGGFRNNSRWGWRVQGTAKRGGDYHTPDYNLSNTGSSEFDFSTTLGFKQVSREFEIYLSSYNTQLAILRSAHTGNLSDLQSSIERERPWYIRDFTWDIHNPRQKIGHHLVKLKARQQVGKGMLNLVYGLQYNQREEYDIRRTMQERPALSLNLFSQVMDAYFDHQKNDWSGSIGINGTYKNNDNVTGTGLLPDYTQFGSGIFLLEKYRRKKWLFELGLRYDYQYLQPRMSDGGTIIKPEFNFNYVSGSAGTSFYISKSSRISSNIAMATRPPHVSELYSMGLHHGTASIEEGLMIGSGGEVYTEKARVKNETSYKWVNTYLYTSKKISAEVSAFVNYFNEYIFLTPYETRLTIRGYFPVFRYQQTDAVLAGGDASFQYELNRHFSYTGKVSWLYAADKTNGNKLPFIPPLTTENGLTYHKGTIGRWKNFYFSVITNFTGKQTRAPQTIYPEDVTGSVEGTFDFMPAPDSWFLVSVNTGANLPLGNRELSVTLSTENLFDVSYRNYMNRLRYYADEPGRNIQLRLRYQFHSHN